MSVQQNTREIQVKNRAAAEHQITVEQLLRDAQEFREDEFQATKRQLQSEDEVLAYRNNKRKEFESRVSRGKNAIGSFIKYAAWEAGQNEFERARSVWERAIEVDYTNQVLWSRYVEFEIAQGLINRARNVLERATKLIPLYSVLWLKWVYMEEKVGNIDGARAVYEKFMQWSPTPESWNAYVNFEVRHGNIEGARNVFERYLAAYPEPQTYIKYAKFEHKHGERRRARVVYERALRELEMDGSHLQRKTEGVTLVVEIDPDLYLAFATFEELVGESERARALYKHALAILPKHLQARVAEQYTLFEKRMGGSEDIERAVLERQRGKYEEMVKEQPHNYDAWLDYIKLEEHVVSDEGERLVRLHRAREEGRREGSGETAMVDAEAHVREEDRVVTADAICELPEPQQLALHKRVRDVYSRAVQQLPPALAASDKRAWKRYIYLWLNWACYEELIAGDVERARAVYRSCLKTIPHELFTFSKVWVNAGTLEVRARQLDQARRLFGVALGKCPRKKIFEAYIGVEMELGNFDRCRVLFQKMLECFPYLSEGWVSYAKMEAALPELERARAILEVGISQELDFPDKLWDCYANIETEAVQFDIEDGRVDAAAEGIWNRVCDVYERRLQRGSSVALWRQYGAFCGVKMGASGMRAVMARADAHYKQDVSTAQAAHDAAVAASKQQESEAVASALTVSFGAGAGMSQGLSTTETLTALIRAKEERVSVLEAWVSLEEELGDEEGVKKVRAMLPQRVKATRKITFRGGAADVGEEDAGYQEYIDYVFPDDKPASVLGGKMMAAMRKWKMQKRAEDDDTGAAKQE